MRKAPLPGMTVGAIVEEETTVSDKQPFFSGGGVYRDVFSLAAFLSSIPNCSSTHPKKQGSNIASTSCPP